MSVTRKKTQQWLAVSSISLMSLAMLSCSPTVKPSLAQQEEKPMYSEKYRPQFHFSPKEGWMGDPDGLVYYGGYYHIFWWGHAISKDLVHWTELPWPMLGDDGSFKYYTGSVVVDEKNTAGLGENSMIAVFSQHNTKDKLETVGLSSSSDYTDFQHYKDSPVLDTKSTDFRDPQVFWHAPTKRWVMVITRPGERKISFYASPDLKKWQHLSDFGGIGAQGNSWEVPDLFQLPVDGKTNTQKWVLTVGVSPNKTQYFLGDFDGTKFTLDDPVKAFLIQGTGLEGTVFADFNGDSYGDWVTTGTAFGRGPSHGDSPAHLGAGQVDSFGSADSDTGTLTSPIFKVDKQSINFLIGGGNHPNQTCINLLVAGKVVRSTTGDNSSGLKWNGWDVSDLQGKSAQIQIVDSYSGGDYGHLSVDHILFSDKLMNTRMEQGLWADYGSDFYAARTWRDIDNVKDRTTWVGWLGNWEYANEVPSSWGRGFQSIPREIGLKAFPEGIRMVQNPIPELQSLRDKAVSVAARPISEGTAALTEFAPARNTYEIEAEFEVTNASATFGFNLLVGEGRKLALGYDAKNQSLFLDRTNTSDFKTNTTFSANFPKTMSAPLAPTNGKVKLHIFVDQSSVEVFSDSGKVVLSALTFPGEAQKGVELFSQKGVAKLVSFQAWELKSIWDSTAYAANKIPGTLEAEDFDKGGEGGGYHDADKENRGGKYRPTESVDIEDGSEGTSNVAWMAPDEWLSYSIHSDYNRTYQITSRVAGDGGRFHFELDGKAITGSVTAPATGDFQKWVSVSTKVNIPFGQHKLRFCVDAGNFNLDKMVVSTLGSDIVSGGVYEIIARHSGRALDASGANDGAAIQQWESLGGDNQKWKIEAVSDGYYKLTAQNSRKALDVNGDKDGTPVLQWPWQDGDNQKWAISEIGGGYFTIRSKNAGKALEVAENSKQNGGKVQQWSYLGGASQQWKLKLISPTNKG